MLALVDVNLRSETQREPHEMTRLWRAASGVAVFLMALFFSASPVLNLCLGEPPLPGFVNRVLLPTAASVVLFLAFAGSYILLSDARKSK